MQCPLLSIVIANYNYGRFLEEAIRSILTQDLPDKVELIICDAASTDNSVEVIKKYERHISWWCSEKDGGQSAAFNKGFARAHGRFLTWLNADDVLLPGTVQRLADAMNANPDCEWYVGGCLWLDPEMRVLKCVRARSFSEMRLECGLVSAWGPSCFFTNKLLQAVGGVDERFHYMMDSDLWLKFANAGYRYCPLPGYAYGLRLHPDAKMSGHNFAQSSQTDSNHPKWAQIKQEERWMLGNKNYSAFTVRRRLITMGWVPFIKGQMDSYRMKGLHYARLDNLGVH